MSGIDATLIARLPAPERAALFLDFDGTLVDLAETPDAIVVPPDLERLLAHLPRRLSGRFAIVTGRAITDIERHLPDYTGLIVGGHGAETRHPDGAREGLQIDEGTLANLQSWGQALVAETPGARLEPKTHGLALHFRQVPEAGEAITRAAQARVNGLDDFVLQTGHAVVEIKPAGAHKDEAVRRLMRDAPFSGHSPIFAGDDRTDLPALKACAEMGGAGIAVGDLWPEAAITLASPEELLAVLTDWSA